ncbi:MAG: stage III sporulation protein AA [Clostridiales bacterium]|jgi:stage III sporulation protein AA|nr:stage III sporulation protein AA [Clostridiales bacterium]
MNALGDIAAGYAGGGLREALAGAARGGLTGVREIRVRLDKPLTIRASGGDHFIAGDGVIVKEGGRAYKPTRKDISVTLELLADYSIYAFQEEIKNGFITIPGGHRVGLSGRCVCEGGAVTAMKNVSGLCYRVAGEVIGCGDAVIDLLRVNKGESPRHTMIISPPGCGKTTLLRDIIRILSHEGLNVGVSDERGEIAGTRGGHAGMDLGPSADVLEGCPKTLGMHMLLRSMSPDVIAADELGREEELEAARDILNAGVSLICSAHGTGVADVRAGRILKEIMGFKPPGRAVVLGRGSRPGLILGVYDEQYNNLYGGGAVG